LTNFNGDNTASKPAALFRRTGDMEIAQIMAEADLKAIDSNHTLYNQHKNKLEDNMQTYIRNYINEINQDGQLIFTNKIINPNLIPIEELNGEKYKVINFTQFAEDTDLAQFGFEPGTTPANLRLAIHNTSISGAETVIEQLDDPNNEALLCVSIISLSHNTNGTFAPDGTILSLETEQYNIANFAPADVGSGNKKNFKHFIDSLFENSNMHAFRANYAKILQENLGISKEQYAELYSQLQLLRYISQLDYIDEFKIGDVTLTGQFIKEAILKAETEFIEEFKDRYTEANFLYPKTNAIIVKTNELKNVPQEILKMAQKYNLPIYLIGSN
jgi:hypothetical protein